MAHMALFRAKKSAFWGLENLYLIYTLFFEKKEKSQWRLWGKLTII